MKAIIRSITQITLHGGIRGFKHLLSYFYLLRNGRNIDELRILFFISDVRGATLNNPLLILHFLKILLKLILIKTNKKYLKMLKKENYLIYTSKLSQNQRIQKDTLSFIKSILIFSEIFLKKI